MNKKAVVDWRYVYSLNRQGFLKDCFCEVKKNEESVPDFGWMIRHVRHKMFGRGVGVRNKYICFG